MRAVRAEAAHSLVEGGQLIGGDRSVSGLNASAAAQGRSGAGAAWAAGYFGAVRRSQRGRAIRVTFGLGPPYGVRAGRGLPDTLERGDCAPFHRDVSSARWTTPTTVC